MDKILSKSCQNPDIRTNSPCCNVLLWTSLCFLPVNQQKRVGMCKEHTLTRSINLFSRNRFTLCYLLRREGRQMPRFELYETDKTSHRSCSKKDLLLKISLYSQENTCVGVS